jgi:hypothetical protein
MKSEPPILNYTTRVPVGQTVGQVIDILVKGGANEVLTTYEAGAPTGIAFGLVTPIGPQRYRLPVHADKVHAVLGRCRVEPRFQTPEHADRVAWRILKDWIEAQLAIVRTEMVSIDQVMLPYMGTADGTVYELFRDHQLALGTGE